MAKKNYKNIELPEKYKPKLSEPYMCPEQLAYFYNILTAQKEELISERDSVLNAVRMAEKTEKNPRGTRGEKKAESEKARRQSSL